MAIPVVEYHSRQCREIFKSSTQDIPAPCDRVLFSRFPPHSTFSDPIVSGYDVPERKSFTTCGSMIELITYINEKSNQTCMQMIDTVNTTSALLQLKTSSADMILYPLYYLSHRRDELSEVMVTLPLGDICEVSIMGREVLTTKVGIRILNLLPTDMWYALTVTLICVSLTVGIVSFLADGNSQEPHSKSVFRPIVSFLYLHWLPNFVGNLAQILGSNYGFVEMKKRMKSRDIRMKRILSACMLAVLIWVLGGLVIKTVAATDIITLMLVKPISDRFSSLANMLERDTSQITLSVQSETILAEMVKSGVTHFLEADILMSDDGLIYQLMHALEDLKRGVGICVGCYDPTYRIRQIFEALEPGDALSGLYLIQDPEHFKPYYLLTSSRWDAARKDYWRYAIFQAVETGLFHAMYQVAFARMAPKVAAEIREQDERSSVQSKEQISILDFWTVIAFTSGDLFLAWLVLQLEVKTYRPSTRDKRSKHSRVSMPRRLSHRHHHYIPSATNPYLHTRRSRRSRRSYPVDINLGHRIVTSVRLPVTSSDDYLQRITQFHRGWCAATDVHSSSSSDSKLICKV